jgi:hypothetical protein
MRCLVCGKKVPLLLQVSGSQFCSQAHRRQHAALQESFAITRLSPPPRNPEPARSALSLPEVGPIAARWDQDQPIPRFQDLILCRKFFSARYTMGLKGAKTIASVPLASLPGEGRTRRADGVSVRLNRFAPDFDFPARGSADH